MKIVVTPEYESLREQVASAPGIVAADDCNVLYCGRNKIVQYEPVDGVSLVVKKYKPHDWLKRVVYTFFRPNKARRSYENARELRKRGFETPHEVAYIEERKWGLIAQVYYICAYTPKGPIRTELIDTEPFDAALATAYARYVASLHNAGVLHRDLNPTNVIYEKTATGYSFELIDINRMRFYSDAVPKKDCMENLTLFWWLTDVYKFVLEKYAAARGWAQSDIDEAVKVKQKHDRSWVRRKKFTGMLKHYILRK